MNHGYYRVHTTTGLVLLVDEGPITFESWRATVVEALREPPKDGTRRVLSDRRRLDPTYPPGMIEEIIHFFREHAAELGDVLWAVVAEGRHETYGLLLLAEELAHATRVRVKAFPAMPEALRWLIGVYEEETILELERWVEGS